MIERELPVVLITDNNYVIPTAVAVQSMTGSLGRNSKLIVYIITCDVDEKNKNLFRELNRYNVKVRIIDCDTKELIRYNEKGYYVTGTALIKFCIPRFLPDYDKILYIDGDVLVRRDVSEIFDTDIESYYAAVVADMPAVVSCRWHKRLGLESYFNSGVLLFNARKFRDEGLEEKLFRVKEAHPEYCCMDQDVFNDVFAMKVRFLPLKWNLMMPNFLLMQDQTGLSVRDINSFFGLDYGSFKEMEEDACIIHLTNEKKPWKYSDIYMSREWYRVFKKTPFRHTKLHREKTIKPPVPLRSRWIGPFHLCEFENRSDMFFLGVPVVRKTYISPCTTVKCFGITVAKRIWYEYEIVTKTFFIIRFRKPNWYNLDEKMKSYIGMIQHGMDDRSSFARKVLIQLSRAKGIVV